MTADMAAGHYVPGADTNHFIGLCRECDAHYMLGASRATIEDWYHLGMISQSQFEAFMHVWATGAYRYGSTEDWEKPPDLPDTLEHVALMRSIIAA
jgi:esterase/lipase superfamily enzyme